MEVMKIKELALQIIAEIDGLPEPEPEPETETESFYVANNVDEVSKAVASGETNIRLAPGEWSDFRFSDLMPETGVTIKPLNGLNDSYPRLRVSRSRMVTFEGFLIENGEGESSTTALIDVREDCDEIYLTGNTVCAAPGLAANPSEYFNWPLEKWAAQKVPGIANRSKGGEIKGNTVIACYMAIGVSGENVRSSNNKVIGFPGDAYRLLGDGASSVNDYCQDAFKINSNHQDCMQSWSRGQKGKVGGGVKKGLHIKGLVARQWTGADAAHPLRGKPQGIGFFDGMFENLLVEDCDLDVGAQNGIAVAGAINCTIRSNKVWDHMLPGDPKRPWIMIRKHKNGTPPSGNTVTGNECNLIATGVDPDTVVEGNFEVVPAN